MIPSTGCVIAHRQSTIAHADRIVVLENSWVVEQGPHQELMQRSGSYHKRVELQVRPPLDSAADIASETALVTCSPVRDPRADPYLRLDGPGP